MLCPRGCVSTETNDAGGEIRTPVTMEVTEQNGPGGSVSLRMCPECGWEVHS